jgi:hypothetical protein
MTIKTSLALILGVLVGVVAGATFFVRQESPKAKGTGDAPLITIGTATSVQIGKDLSTQAVATNTARRLLRISNVSGATTTPSDVYCASASVGSLYSGFWLQASSTYIMPADQPYFGPFNCKATTATATVTVLEQ